MRYAAAGRIGGLVLACATALASLPAAGQPAEDPYWPCIQRKVPSLTPAAVWTGPAFEEGEAWKDDGQVADLVRRLSQRRLPTEAAETEIASFAAGLEDDAAMRRLSSVFAGLFETMNAERSQVIEGIERYARRQIDMAEAIRTRASSLDRARRAPDADPQAIAREEDELIWQTRVFEERRASLSAVCDAPRNIEQRLFALGRAITAALPKVE